MAAAVCALNDSQLDSLSQHLQQQISVVSDLCKLMFMQGTTCACVNKDNFYNLFKLKANTEERMYTHTHFTHTHTQHKQSTCSLPVL